MNYELFCGAKSMVEVLVKVSLSATELKLLRRALAKAADDGLLDRTAALKRICALDRMRWDAEEKAASRRASKLAS